MRLLNNQPSIRLAAGILSLAAGLFAQTAILTGDAVLQAYSPQINFGALPQIELGPNAAGWYSAAAAKDRRRPVRRPC